MLRQFVQTIRQNHALEHATLHVLARRSPGVRLVGRSSSSGFAILGPVATDDLQAAAAEALGLLQGGQSELAVHPNCGTNAVVTGVLVGGSAFVAGVGNARSRWERLPMALLAATLAAILAPPLAHFVQGHVTTSAALEGVRLDGIQRQVRGGLTMHQVRVRRG